MRRRDPSDPVWTVARAEADIFLCTTSILQTIVSEKQALALVWPEEGDFNEHDDWVFNADHMPPNFPVYEPLLCDIQTASLLMQMRDALGEEPIVKTTHPFYGKTRREAFDARISESRAYMVLFVEKCWKLAKFG